MSVEAMILKGIIFLVLIIVWTVVHHHMREMFNRGPKAIEYDWSMMGPLKRLLFILVFAFWLVGLIGFCLIVFSSILLFLYNVFTGKGHRNPHREYETAKFFKHHL
jgi:hypothetical protein